jgi:hypothetical protein
MATVHNTPNMCGSNPLYFQCESTHNDSPRSCVTSGAQAIIRGQITEAEREHSVFGRPGGAPSPRGGPSANVRARLADAQAMPQAGDRSSGADLHGPILDVEERLVIVNPVVGGDEAEAGPDECPLRSDVV